MPEKKNGLIISDRAIIIPEEKYKKKEFASFFDERAKDLCVNRRYVADKLGIDYERFRKIINGTNPTKKRECIIACCFALWMNSGQTCTALNMYGFPQLDFDLPRDDYISQLLQEQEDKKRSIDQINDLLIKRDGKELDIIDHRKCNRNKKDNKESKRYSIIKLNVETRLDELVFGDKYNSLVTEYSPKRYRVTSKMIITDNVTGKSYSLTSDPDGNYSYTEYPIVSLENYHSFNSLEATGDLRSFFEIAQSYARQELANKSKTLLNSRNYENRISASIIDNTLHIYTERYNYRVPELHEYYLMDYAEGNYHLTISDKSRFMELYLTPEEYKEFYGDPSSKIIYSFRTEDDILSAIETEYDYSKKALMKTRLYSYRLMRSQITDFLQHLNKDTYIVDPEIIDDNDIDLKEWFSVPEEKPDWLDDGDLEKGFILGLHTLEQIKSFKEKHASLDINENI